MATATPLTLQLVHASSVRPSSYGCTREVWKAQEKCKRLFEAQPRATLASGVLSKLSAYIHNAMDALFYDQTATHSLTAAQFFSLKFIFFASCYGRLSRY